MEVQEDEEEQGAPGLLAARAARAEELKVAVEEARDCADQGKCEGQRHAGERIALSTSWGNSVLPVIRQKVGLKQAGDGNQAHINSPAPLCGVLSPLTLASFPTSNAIPIATSTPTLTSNTRLIHIAHGSIPGPHLAADACRKLRCALHP